MTDNIEKIVQEAECVAAADEYFKARTWLMDTNDNRRIFEAGFDRAYALLSKQRAPVADERAAFEKWWNSEISHSLYAKMTPMQFAEAAWKARAALASAPVAGEAQPVAWLHQCRKKPELATVTMNKREPALAAKGYRPIPLYAAPQASEAVRGEPDATGRTPTDYALEFAEYLARDVEYAVACLNSSQRANEALLDLTEEVATAGAYQAAEDAAAQADEAFTEAITALQSAVFEFRKRRDRAALSAQPSGNPGELGAQRATVRNPLTVQSSGNSGELSAQPGAQKKEGA